MKAYTDIEQSKTLAEILPLESADMCFNISQRSNMPPLMTPYSKFKEFFDMDKTPDFLIPCWSLAALLSALPYTSLHETFSGWRCDSYNKEGTSCILGVPADNPVDACYEMILKLHELNLL